MNQTLYINGIDLWAYHGCLAEEAVIGGKYRVDVRFVADFAPSAATDDLEKTVDYVRVVELVREQMAIRSKLIETVAARMVAALSVEFHWVENIHLSLTKYAPPVNGPLESSSIQWHWQRQLT